MVGKSKFWQQIPMSVRTLVVNTNKQCAQEARTFFYIIFQIRDGILQSSGLQ